jgi:dTDP-4-dehydrorhamnose reductase
MILVFGANGQVATELERQAEVFALGRDQADLADPDACAKAILASDADVVINAAAYTAVDKAEDEEALAAIINGEAPSAMARACAEKGIPFLHVSTDYVFAGDGKSAWAEGDPVAPQNAYGRSKLVGEQGVLAAGGNNAVIRTSWVFSAHGNNFVKSMLRLSETRDALKVVDDQIGGPTPADKIADALLKMAEAMMAGQQAGLYHFSGQPETSWSGFAKEIFRQAGKQVDVIDISTAEYPTPAARPLNSRLDCSKINRDFGIDAPDWKDGLTRVLLDLKEMNS